jgi:DNA-binding LacI/PurR family transcriptional regulator
MEHEQFVSKSSRITLKTVADHVGLTAGTISAVLNNTRAAARIPQVTRDRIFAAARELNYQPNALARALRAGGTFAVQQSAREMNSPRGAVVILRGPHFDRAINAIEQAGLRLNDDFSVLGLNDVTGAWDSPVIGSAPEYLPYDSAVKAS